MTEQFFNVWFSYREYRHNAHRKNNSFLFEWTKDIETWDWNDCTVTAVPGSDGRIKVIIRNTDFIHSTYVGKKVGIRYMYDFDITNVPEPELDWYYEPPPKNTPGKKYGQKRQRWVIHLEKNKKDNKDGNENKDCWIWEWSNESKKEETTVYKIYQMLKKTKESLQTTDEIFQVPVAENNDIIPVVYQPALDSWKNFVREIHCHKLGTDEYEITIMMNGEQLRKHKILDPLYRIIRKELYHRLQDVETFRILLKDKVPENFLFSGIYSDDHNIFDDDIHGDKLWFFEKNVPTHKIKFYFSNKKHPIIFINTSNHAMAEHDNNPFLWKWEYVGWDPSSPIKIGNKSRQEVEESYKTSSKKES